MDVDLSDFLWETCVRRQKCNAKVVHALTAEVTLMQSVQRNHLIPDGRAITTVTGSVSEFHIDTPLSCINDIDVMHHRNDMILVPPGRKIPTHLPPGYSDKVTLCEITDSGYTGYVHVEQRQVLVKDQAANYEETAVHHGLCKYKLHKNLCRRVHHGKENDVKSCPAQEGSFMLKGDPSGRYYEPLLKTDWVPCLRCLLWPLQATDWPQRHRNHGWPDKATIEFVVDCGCDVVTVSHRKTFGNIFQFRLSFSRAETVLLNFCTKSQQIVYHVLRYIVKTERLADIRDSSGRKMFSGYHIKTLLLWACELKPRDWWEDHQKLLGMCAALLKILIKWLCTGDVKHYFVKGWKLPPEGNSEVESGQNNTIICRLQAVIDNLPQWFYYNYVCRYAGRTSNPSILNQTKDAKTAHEMHSALRGLVQFRLNHLRSSAVACAEHVAISSSLHSAVAGRFTTVQSCSHLFRRLAQIDERLSLFLHGVLFTNFAEDLNNKFMTGNAGLDIIYTALVHSDHNRAYVDVDAIEIRSVWNIFRKASVMIRTSSVAIKSTSAVSLTRIKQEMAKWFLHSVLECKKSDVIASRLRCLSHVYLAALYLVTGQYQTAIDHCNMVTAADNHSQCTSHIVERSLLPHIDDDIDNVCGLVVLCEFIKDAALNQQQTQRHSAVFTTELFACYLQLTALSAMDKRPSELLATLQVYYSKLIAVSSIYEPLATDVLLYRLYVVKHDDMLRKVCFECTIRDNTLPCSYPPFTSVELCDAVRRAAVSYLKEFRSFELLEFGVNLVLNEIDFDAISSLFCGDYERCLAICRWELTTAPREIIATEIVLLNEYMLMLICDLLPALGLLNIYRHSSFLITGQLHQMKPVRTVTRLTLLFFLYAESQMKLGLPRASFIETLDIVKAYHELALKYRHLDASPASEPVYDAMLINFLYRKIQRYVQNCTS